MQEVFRRHLQPLNEGVYQLRGCQIFHVRYQQALGRCILQYDLRIAEYGTGRGWDDPNLEHIMLDGEHLLLLLDLDRFAEADPVLDTARVLAGFAAMPHQFSFPRDRAQAAAQIFAEEYFLHVPESWRLRLPLHYAGAVLKSAGGGLRNQYPGWSEQLEDLVEEARRSLAGEIW